MEADKFIRRLREQTGLSRRAFSEHMGIPVRTLEDWEAGRRTPPEYIPRLMSYQLELEKLQKGEKEKEYKHSIEIITDADGDEITFVNDQRLKGQQSVNMDLLKAILAECGLKDCDHKIAVPIYDEKNELKRYEILWERTIEKNNSEVNVTLRTDIKEMYIEE